MLIDVSYFVKGSRHIQNASLSGTMGTDSRTVNAVITSYIEEYQHRFLKAMMGESEANNVENYLSILEQEASGEIDPSSTPSKYELICRKLREPFANYVMFYILRNSNVQSTVTGTVKLKCANEYVSPIRKEVEMWNEMVDMNQDFLNWIRNGGVEISIETETNMLIKTNIFNV